MFLLLLCLNKKPEEDNCCMNLKLLCTFVQFVEVKESKLLVSTCERLSEKQVLAAVVEILVQKSQFTLNWDLVPILLPCLTVKLKFGQDLAL